MAGAGYKLFNTGDVLTAAQVNTYLQEQAVMRFANSTARTTALSGVLAEGMMSYLDDTNSVEVYNGSAWVSVGSTGDITGVTAGTGISGGGTSGDVTITNSMATAIDAKGDLVVGTGADTFDRLAVGANNTVLTADSSTATGLKWAAASQKFEYITRSTFSGSATVTIDNIFSSTYETYAIVFERILQSSNANMRAQFRYGSTTQNAGYYSNVVCFAGTQTQQLDNNTTYATLMHNMNSSQASAAIMYVNGVGQTSERAYYHGTGVAGGLGPGCPYIFSCWQINTQTYTGIEFTSSAGNLTGEITVYGIRNS